MKQIAVEEIAETVRAIVQRQAVISPSMTTKLLSEFRSLARRASEREELAPTGLTDREMQVLQLMAQSKSNKDIASALFISENTVKNHVRNILEKLHLHSRMEAVTYAWRKRLAPRPDGRVAAKPGAPRCWPDQGAPALVVW